MINEKTWEKNYERLSRYCETYHSVPTVKEDSNLFNWIRNTRKSLSKGILPEECIRKLDNLLSEAWRDREYSTRVINEYLAIRVVVPSVLDDIGIDVLYGRCIICKQEFLRFIRRGKLYLSDLINQTVRDSYLSLNQIYEGIRVVYDLPEYGWYRLWCMICGYRGYSESYDIVENIILNIYLKKDMCSIEGIRNIKDNFEYVEKIFNCLNKRDLKIVKEFIVNKKTYEEIGRLTGLCKGYVYQVCQSTLKKLKNPDVQEFFIYKYVDGVYKTIGKSRVDKLGSIKDSPIDILKLPTRTYNSFKLHGINNIDDLVEYLFDCSNRLEAELKLSMMRNVGEVGAKRCISSLESFGILSSLEKGYIHGKQTMGGVLFTVM